MGDTFSNINNAVVVNRNRRLTDYEQEVIIAETVLAAMPDQDEARQVIMTGLSPKAIMNELHARGFVIAPAD